MAERTSKAGPCPERRCACGEFDLPDALTSLARGGGYVYVHGFFWCLEDGEPIGFDSRRPAAGAPEESPK